MGVGASVGPDLSIEALRVKRAIRASVLVPDWRMVEYPKLRRA